MISISCPYFSPCIVFVQSDSIGFVVKLFHTNNLFILERFDNLTPCVFADMTSVAHRLTALEAHTVLCKANILENPQKNCDLGCRVQSIPKLVWKLREHLFTN